MPIAIILRTSGSINVFRDAIIDALKSNHIDDALLCSGSFQENFKGSAYQASTEKQLGKICAKKRYKFNHRGYSQQHLEAFISELQGKHVGGRRQHHMHVQAGHALAR